MPAMTKTALSDCSYPESTVYNIRDDIDATITRLKAVIDQEVSLRNALRALFDKRREDASEQLRMANLHLHLVHQEEAAFCADVRRASTKIKEELGGSVTTGLLRANLVPQYPLSFELPSSPPVHVTLGLREDVQSRMSSPLHVNLSPGPDGIVDAVYDTSLRPPATPPPPCMPQQSPSIYSFAPPGSPARSSRAFSPTRSPVRYAYGMDLTKSHVQPTRGPDGNQLPRSPALSNGGPPCDAPAPSPANKKKENGGGGGEDRAQPGAQTKYRETKEDDAEQMVREAERVALDMIGEEPKKAAETKPNEAKKKKSKSKKGNTKDTDAKPTPNVLSPASEAPPNLDANEPKSPGVGVNEEFTAEDTGLDFFVAALAKNKQGTPLKPTPPSKRAAKAKKTTLLSMSTEDLTGEGFAAIFDKNPQDPLKNPARSAHGLDPTRSPARSARRLDDGLMPISPVRSNRRLPSDAPPRSPTRSTRGLEDPYLFPDAAGHSRRTPGSTQTSLPAFSFVDDCGFGIEEPKNSPLTPVAALPMAFALGGGGFGTSPTTNTGFGFGASPTVNTTFGFGASPTPNTGFPFGAGSQPPSTSIGFGAASLGNTGFEFGGTSPTINFGLHPHHPAFGLNGQNEGLDGDFEMFDPQDNIQTPPAREPSPKPEPPEEPPVAVVAPKKKKKGKKIKGAPATYFLADEQAVMEEIKLSEEDPLEAELKRIEAEEVEMAELDRREEARLKATAAENERINRALLENERQLEAEEEEGEYLHYLSLKEAAVVAEGRLSMVQAELDALEAQKTGILQQAESAREKEASCRYHEIMRSR